MNHMRTGLTSVTFRQKSVEEIIALAAQAGLSGIEWGGDVHVAPGDAASAAETARKTREAGLAVLSYGSYYRGGEGEDFAPILASARALGAPVIRALRPAAPLFFDVHLMIDEPMRYLDDFAEAGADLITIHLEAARKVSQTLDAIRKRNCLAGLSIKPATPVTVLCPYLAQCDTVLIMSVEPGFGGQKFIPEATDKIRRLFSLREQLGLAFSIEVDGGINAETAPLCIAAGADILVAGSAVFTQSDYKSAVEALRNPMSPTPSPKS